MTVCDTKKLKVALNRVAWGNEVYLADANAVIDAMGFEMEERANDCNKCILLHPHKETKEKE